MGKRVGASLKLEDAPRDELTIDDDDDEEEEETAAPERWEFSGEHEDEEEEGDEETTAADAAAAAANDDKGWWWWCPKSIGYSDDANRWWSAVKWWLNDERVLPDETAGLQVALTSELLLPPLLEATLFAIIECTWRNCWWGRQIESAGDDVYREGEREERDGDETDAADAAAAITAAAAFEFPPVATIFSIKLLISSCLLNPPLKEAGIGERDDEDEDEDNGVVDDDDIDGLQDENGAIFNLE